MRLGDVYTFILKVVRKVATPAVFWDLFKDIMVFGGLAMAFYGLNLFCPWLAYTLCGTVLMLLGLTMRT